MITSSIVTYNTKQEDLDQLIKSISSSIIEEIYVIDNSPKDSLKDFVEKLSTKVTYIHGQGNVGFGAAHNIAIQKAIGMGSKYHFVVNPDIIIKEDVISPMITYIQTEENIGMMMPQILNLDDTVQYLPKLLPSPFAILLRKLKRPSKVYNWFIYSYELRNINKICNIPIVSGCFSLFNLDLLKEVGVYDERFFMYFEDFDLSRRMHQKYKTLYYPLVSVYHGYEGGANKNWKLFKIFIMSAIKYFNKWGWFFDNERNTINQQTLGKTL